tara:strand:- start:38262 stop:38546 length:285 start_codon:yes stop_codon:yes gene_type:complete
MRTTTEIALNNISKNTGSLTRPTESKFINDTADHVGTFQALIAMTDAELDISSCLFGDNMITYDADFTLPKGVTIYGIFETVSLASGSIIAYKL